MKYKAPYGSSDPEASYVDRSTPNAQTGSRVPKQAVEAPQREIVKVITEAGIVPDEADNTQLWQAIKALIAAATAPLQMYPDVMTSDKNIAVTQVSPGIIRVPAGVEIVMRGTKRFTTVQTDLVTLSNTTYHLRYAHPGVFTLKSLSDAVYNPGVSLASDTLAKFDSDYDDMLVAKIVTNGSNVATITQLANAPVLDDVAVITATDPFLSNQNAANFLVQRTLNWARSPRIYNLVIIQAQYNNTFSDSDVNIMAVGVNRSDVNAVNNATSVIPVTRYKLEAIIMRDGTTTMKCHFFARAA